MELRGAKVEARKAVVADVVDVVGPQLETRCGVLAALLVLHRFQRFLFKWTGDFGHGGAVESVIANNPMHQVELLRMMEKDKRHALLDIGPACKPGFLAAIMIAY